MKKKLVLILIFVVTTMSAKNFTTINYNNRTFTGEIVYSSKTCEIVKITDENQNPLFIILATALQYVGIEYGRSVCIKVADPEICNAVADGVGLISGGFNAGKIIYRSAMNGSLKYSGKHIIEKGIGKRILEYATEGFNTAVSIKNVIEAYDKLKVIKWENFNFTDKLNTKKNNNGVKFYLKNNTRTNLIVELSYDGKDWKSFKLDSGFSNNYQAHIGETIQSYGFVKVGNCVFQLKTGYKYQVDFDNTKNEFIIIEK